MPDTEIRMCINCQNSDWPQHEHGVCKAAEVEDNEERVATMQMRVEGYPCGPTGELYKPFEKEF
ncbi:MAG: hypothetical protein ACPHEP_01725 [Acidimicrobiales bacterium]